MTSTELKWIRMLTTSLDENGCQREDVKQIPFTKLLGCLPITEFRARRLLDRWVESGYAFKADGDCYGLVR